MTMVFFGGGFMPRIPSLFGEGRDAQKIDALSTAVAYALSGDRKRMEQHLNSYFSEKKVMPSEGLVKKLNEIYEDAQHAKMASEEA